MAEVNDKWKDKYFELVDAHEHLELSKQSIEELLAKVIIKLSFAISGFDGQLDPQLQRIRDCLKNGVDSQKLKAELDDFTDALARITDLSVQGKSSDVELMFDFLLFQASSAKQKTALLQVKADAKNNLYKSSQQLFAALAKTIDTKPSDETTASVASQDAINFSDRIDTGLVSRQLLNLFDNIEIPGVFDSQVQAIKQLLASQHTVPAYEQILDKSVNLLLKISQHIETEQQGIDQFLAHITEQLTELGITVYGASTAAEKSAIIRNKLNQSVEAQMKALQLSSTNATKLEPLKEIINQRLETITKEIQEHNQEEAEQRQKTQQRLDELTQKVKVMESESNDLKLKLKIAHTKALRDELTGLPNRLAYQERLQTELARWRRYRSPLSLIVWDIDYFKSINDQYGHKAGDKALELIAKLLSSNCRATDFISRFGGEEFVMLLPDTGKEPVLKLANQLRLTVEKSGFNSNGKAIKITISCGITEFIENDTDESAFNRADQALYKAKQQGRNQCCLS